MYKSYKTCIEDLYKYLQNIMAIAQYHKSVHY